VLARNTGTSTFVAGSTSSATSINKKNKLGQALLKKKSHRLSSYLWVNSPWDWSKTDWCVEKSGSISCFFAFN